MERINPTDILDVRFSEYVAERRLIIDAHMEMGIPDYAYGSDYVLRQKIKAIPGAYGLAKAIANHMVPKKKQEMNLKALKVGPDQFPDIYKMAVDCAKTLGIGIPTVFIENDIRINAFTMATEDESPIIVFTSGLIERFTPGEIKYVMGHECGHIHNNHGIYNIVAVLIINAGLIGGSIALPVIIPLLNALTIPLQLAIQTWSRAAEVSCDRAGIICSDDMNDVISATAKFLYGGTFNRSDINIDALMKQYEQIRQTPVRLMEIDSTHPVPVRRIFAAKEFMDSEVLYKWRPEWKQPDMNLISKQELDLRCNTIISVTKGKKKRGINS